MLVATVFLIAAITIFSNDNVSEGYKFVDTRENYLERTMNTGNRNYIFDDSNVDFCIMTNNSTYQQISKEALKEWHLAITQATNNEQVWNITSHILPNDHSICDGFINFQDIPEFSHYAYSGILGLSDPLQQKANITIFTKFYQEALREINDEQWKNMTKEKFKNIIQSGTHNDWSIKDIKRVILHELGHAFSLNHPCEIHQCDLFSQDGIMGYNMSNSSIEEFEAKQIVLSYPNGFEERDIISFEKLDNKINQPRVYYEGEMINILLEFPKTPKELRYTGFAFYMYPDNPTPLTSDKPALTFSKLKGNLIKQGIDSNEFFKNFHAFSVSKIGHSNDYEIEKYTVTASFIAKKEMSEIKMTFVLEDQSGQQKQFEFDSPFIVKKALFSDILFDLHKKQNIISFKLNSDSPNKEIENQYYKDKNEQSQYYKQLRECLSKNNSKYCNEHIIRN